MRKAEYYLNEFKPMDFLPSNILNAIVRVIKMAQIDAINETTTQCIEYAEISLFEDNEFIISDNEFENENPDGVSCKYIINDESITKIKDILIKMLDK